MRRVDKTNNMAQANLLAEQRYLSTKDNLGLTNLPPKLSGKLLESKQTEAQALNILKKANIPNPETVVSNLAKEDISKNQKNVPLMAFIYVNGTTNVKMIGDVLGDYNDLEEKQRIAPIKVENNKLKIGDNLFSDFIKFSEFIHGQKSKYAPKSTASSSVNAVDSEAVDIEPVDQPMWSGNGIDIFEGSDVGKCIKYTQGALTNQGYEFCIGKPGSGMYFVYRNNKASSFYFIVDKNKMTQNADGSTNLSNPLHMVVFDRTKAGIELTDATNDTGNIAEYGSDTEAYVAYLKSKGVPVDKLINNPQTKEEKIEEKLLGNANSDLAWFVALSMDYKSKYIGRGHVLTNEQFDYLIN